MSDTMTIDGVVYSADKKVLIKYPEDKADEAFYIPESVEEIGEDSFAETKGFMLVSFCMTRRFEERFRLF